jgi:hypothetical protein
MARWVGGVSLAARPASGVSRRPGPAFPPAPSSLGMTGTPRPSSPASLSALSSSRIGPCRAPLGCRILAGRRRVNGRCSRSHATRPQPSRVTRQSRVEPCSAWEDGTPSTRQMPSEPDSSVAACRWGPRAERFALIQARLNSAVGSLQRLFVGALAGECAVVEPFAAGVGVIVRHRRVEDFSSTAGRPWHRTGRGLSYVARWSHRLPALPGKPGGNGR